MHYHLEEIRASEDAGLLERAWECRREVREEHASSGSPIPASRRLGGSVDNDDVGPYGIGCRAFSSDLCKVDWPTKFQPDLLEKYDCTIEPEEFLQIYTMTIQAAGGGPKVIANYFHVARKGTTRSWLMNIP